MPSAVCYKVLRSYLTTVILLNDKLFRYTLCFLWRGFKDKSFLSLNFYHYNVSSKLHLKISSANVCIPSVVGNP